MSTGVIAGLVWIGFAAHHPRTAAVMAALVERILMLRSPGTPKDGLAWRARRCQNVVFIVGDNVGWRDIGYDGPVATRRGALQQPITRYPNVTPGEEFTGYS